MLTDRWAVLALLFFVRTAMGFQFQAVPALSPLFIAQYGISAADLGLLIGLYHAPGIALALAGGAIGQRLGDKRVVAAGLALMLAGGLMMALLPSWPMQIAGRLVAGVGGILLNVLMSKMVVDWFAGREIATAMGIFVNSWPVGIALGLIVSPAVASVGGLEAALLVVSILVAFAFVALVWLYQPPTSEASAPGAGSAWPRGASLAAVLAAGGIWGLYNGSLAMIFGFGPLMLSQQGWSVATASQATSVVLWLVALSVPLGGILADRVKRPGVVMLGGFAAFALTLVLATRTETVLAVFVLLGLVSGLPAGPIMSLPSMVLTPATRAYGMGLYFTMFYTVQLVAPWGAGHVAAVAGSARAAFDLGALMLAACTILLALFWRLRRSEAGLISRTA